MSCSCCRASSALVRAPAASAAQRGARRQQLDEPLDRLLRPLQLRGRHDGNRRPVALRQRCQRDAQRHSRAEALDLAVEEVLPGVRVEHPGLDRRTVRAREHRGAAPRDVIEDAQVGHRQADDAAESVMRGEKADLDAHDPGLARKIHRSEEPAAAPTSNKSAEEEQAELDCKEGIAELSVEVDHPELPARLRNRLALIPAALLAALIVANTVTLGQRIVIDARLAGVAAAAVAAWRRLPFPAVIAIGAGVTALVRFLAS